MNEIHDARTILRHERLTVIAAILLLLGCCIPMVRDSYPDLEIDWMGIETISDPSTPWQVQFYMFLPALTLILTLISLFVKSPATRTILRIVAGFLPLALILFAGQISFLTDSPAFGRMSTLGPGSLGAGLLQLAGVYLGPLAMYVGANASLLNPGSKRTVHIAFAGAILLAIGLCMPTFGRNGIGNAILTSALALIVHSPLMGILSMLIMGCAVFAIVVTVVWWSRRHHGAMQGAVVRRLLNAACILILLSGLSYIASMLFMFRLMPLMFIGVAMMTIKLVLCFIAWYQLKIVGLSPISAR